MITTLRVQPDSTVIHSSTIKVTPDAMGAKCQCLDGTASRACSKTQRARPPPYMAI